MTIRRIIGIEPTCIIGFATFWLAAAMIPPTWLIRIWIPPALNDTCAHGSRPFAPPARRAVLRRQRQRDSSLWTPFLRCGGEWVRLLLFIRTASSRQQDGGTKGRLRQISMSARITAIKFLILYHKAGEVKIIFRFAEKYFFRRKVQKSAWLLDCNRTLFHTSRHQWINRSVKTVPLFNRYFGS